MATNNLSTFRALFIVKGILNLLIAFFFIGYAAFVISILNIEGVRNNPDLTFNPGLLVGVICGIGALIAIVFGILTILAGNYLTQHKNYNFIFVITILNCLSGVLGIILGVFTIIELTKPEVKALFGKN